MRCLEKGSDDGCIPPGKLKRKPNQNGHALDDAKLFENKDYLNFTRNIDAKFPSGDLPKFISYLIANASSLCKTRDTMVKIGDVVVMHDRINVLPKVKVNDTTKKLPISADP